MERSKYKGKIVEVVEFDVEQAGKQMVFECARRSPGVRLIIPKGDKILLTKEEQSVLVLLRYLAGTSVLTVPSPPRVI